MYILKFIKKKNIEISGSVIQCLSSLLEKCSANDTSKKPLEKSVQCLLDANKVLNMWDPAEEIKLSDFLDQFKNSVIEKMKGFIKNL